MLNLYKSLLLFFFLIFSLNSTFAQNFPELEKVKEIKLLESTRDDVRRILAEYELQPQNKSNHSDIFSSPNFEIEVNYSEGRCKNNESEGFDLAEWKTGGIKLSPKNRLKLHQFGFRLSKFKKEYTFTNSKHSKVYHRKDLGILIIVDNEIVESIYFEPPKKYYTLLCDKERAKRLLSTSSYFDPTITRDIISDFFGPVPDVENLILSFTEITASCSSDSDKKTCSDDIKNIAVFTYAKCEYGCIMTYNYQVSGGKIIQLGEKSIGLSEKVLWDLSNVKPGTYTITAAVDDGCGFCGKTMTKTITVKECADCKKP